MANEEAAAIAGLVKTAEDARDKSEARYSHFRVGAAIESKDGKIYSGFNIESSSYGLSMCAERVAVWKAITAGESKFRRIAIVSDAKDFCSPCGACRQVLFELAGDIDVYMTNHLGEIRKERLSSLLPFAFTSETITSKLPSAPSTGLAANVREEPVGRRD